MPEITRTSRITYGEKVPETGLPLAHVMIPTPRSGRDLKVVDASESSVYNISGLVTKSTMDQVTINLTNVTNSLAATGILSINKLPDGSFASSANWNDAKTGTWEFLTLGGRTETNSTYETGYAPALDQAATYKPYCLRAAWSNTLNSTISMQSSGVALLSATEAGYTKDNVAHQLTLWIASDPVDSAGVRRSGTSSQSVKASYITIQVLGYTAPTSGATLTEILHEETLSYSNPATRHYFTQPSQVYLRYRSDMFRATLATTQALKVRITGKNINGVYFDDFILRSWAYAPSITVRGGDAPIYNTLITNVHPGRWEQTGTLPTQPEFRDDRITNSYLGPYGNLVVNGGFELRVDGTLDASGWTGDAHISSAIYPRGGTRNGLYCLELVNPTVDYLYTDVTSFSYTNKYYCEAWYQKVPEPTVDGDVELKVEVLDSVDAVLTTVSATGVGTSAWQKLQVTVDPTAQPTATKARVTLTCVKGGGSEFGGCKVDDVSMYLYTDYITGWVKELNSPRYGPNELLLEYGLNDNFIARGYTKAGDAAKYHMLSPKRERIFNRGVAMANSYYMRRYWNTEDIIHSQLATVSPAKRYKLSFNLAWDKNIEGSMDIKNIFSLPTIISYSTVEGELPFPWQWFIVDGENAQATWGKIKILEWGMIRAEVRWYDSGDNYITNAYLGGTEPFLDLTPRTNNLPPTATLDPSCQWFYSSDVSSVEVVPPATAAKASIYITFRGTSCGVRNVRLAEFGYSGDQTTTVENTYTGLSAGNKVKVQAFSDQIKLNGVEVDDAGCWRLLLQDGLFELPYTVTSYESSGSLIKSAGYKTGDELKLVYTVPEYNLDTQFNNQEHLEEKYRVKATPLNSSTLFLGETNIWGLNELLINGTVYVSGSTSGSISFDLLATSYPDLVASVDSKKGTVTLKLALHDEDDIKASYTYKVYQYIYRGYFDGRTWNDLDLNPAAGHRFHVEKDGRGLPTSDLINSGVTLYLLPTASYAASSDVSGVYNYTSLMHLRQEIRPLSFVRHLVGTNVDELIQAMEPSAVILGKVFVLPPCNIGDIKLLDVRTRGGGTPDDWDINTPDFIEETNYYLPTSSTAWFNTKLELGTGDILEVAGFGTAGTSPSGTLWGNIGYSTPAASGGGFHIGTSYSTAISSGEVGLLSLSVYNVTGTGNMYVRVRVKRKTTKKSRWDVGSTWDGEPVSLNGTLIVEIPKEILTGTGGYRQLTAQEIDEAVKKHTPAGILPLVRFL